MAIRITRPIKNILVLRPDRLGDVILTLPTIRNIHAAYPEARITYLCTSYTAEILRTYTLIDDTFIYDAEGRHAGLKGIVALAKELAAGQYDLAIHLLPRHPLALATYLAGIKYCLGTGYRWFSFFYTDRHYEHRKYNLHHEAEYNLRLAEKAGISSEANPDVFTFFSFDEATLSRVADKTVSLFNSDPFIIIHPGSGRSSYDWPQSHFITLIRLINERTDYRVGITGLEKERSLLKPFETANIDYVDLIGQFSLPELAVLLKSAKLLVVNSTGPLHLAVAMGTPLLGFYALAPSLGPERWGPYLRSSLEYITPVRGESSETRDGHLIDMASISPERVFERVLQILSV